MSDTNLVMGGFNNGRNAQLAVNELERRGVPHKDISVLMADTNKESFAKIEKTNQAAEGAGTGGAIGTAAGALAAGLTAAAGIAVPGVGLLATGPIVAALTGAGAGAATGGTLGALVGMGAKKDKVKFHESVLKDGGVVVAVTSKSKDVKENAEVVMKEHALDSKTTKGRVAQL